MNIEKRSVGKVKGVSQQSVKSERKRRIPETHTVKLGRDKSKNNMQAGR